MPWKWAQILKFLSLYLCIFFIFFLANIDFTWKQSITFHRKNLNKGTLTFNRHQSVKLLNFNFHMRTAQFFSLQLQKKFKRGPFHFTEETLIFWLSGIANFSLPITIEITMGLGCPVWVLWVPAIGLGVPWKWAQFLICFFVLLDYILESFFIANIDFHQIKSSPLHFNEKTWKGGIMWAGFTSQKVGLPLKVSNFLSSHFHMRTVQFFLCH